VATPGGITISARVHEDLLGKLEIGWQDGGRRQLKNIATPIHVFHWAEAGGEAEPVAERPSRPVIAVLPLDNMSGNADDGFFCDGVAEDIITGLARYRSLLVIARNSSFAFRGQTLQLSEIAAKLGADYMLEGSVRRSGSRVRVTVQLIEGDTGNHVWAERYDRDLTDIFEVQDQVVATIVATLVGRIEDANYRREVRKPTTSLAAYDLLLRGIVYFRGYEDDANQRAYDCLERAIALDSHYAIAHAYLALVTLAVNGYSAAPAEIKAHAAELAEKAVKLDPHDGTCHRLLGHVLLYVKRYNSAEQHMIRALELLPNNADCITSMGFVLGMRGRAQEGVEWIERAIGLNPFHPPWYFAQLATLFYSLRRFEDAVAALTRMPRMEGWSFRLVAAYGMLGRVEEAVAEAQRMLDKKPGFSSAFFVENETLLETAADKRLLLEGLLRAGLPA
jgi:adenylate cyclase